MTKVSKKTFKEIKRLISDVISFNNITELEGNYKLFENPPDMWCDEEKDICDYQARISVELINGLEKILGLFNEGQKEIIGI